jgi:hypothetical protein
MEFTKEQIQYNLVNDIRWTERALVVLFEDQTREEQESNHTHVDNGVGFNGSDAPYLSYCAKWVKSGRHLNDVHFKKCGLKLKKYWKQISVRIKK